ncbi:NADH dehydrogenase [ubiquinone] 1 beta subcomplex subunit 2, mitochondrial-like [Bombus vosnesenskii]|uniref:NADH dehydrogenase [ubiquinone] 1 beta subcomplex subunit 2, mitochondrial-like n=1 Tax=Bombus vosnesenskii TaxID=207650 RepID=A0A6J3LJ51_9HYME|nr:NADH dehydrogenase [ubiquinone] 1 beta subcomplex subunit 2, mitochondrial-like [Bombus vosnesenskii]XP_050494392.1 NADH dehydrogenase [ubiquinone] 1 beta subcomplex subunit 2, mitochondrial-like [Bombus huntii]
MLLSRGPSILRNIYELNGRKQTGVNLQQIRKCWTYRTVTEPKRHWKIIAECVGGVVWWWIFWNAWHDYEHITGHFPEIRPIEWSDEELGIPPDD